MTHPITLNQRTATTVAQLVERTQQAQETLRTYVETVGSALDVPAGWRFDVQAMAFVPPVEQPAEQPAEAPAEPPAEAPAEAPAEPPETASLEE